MGMTLLAPTESGTPFSLNGQLLVAMPGIGDERFDRTVIYVCAHSPEGAMGLIINRPADEIAFVDLLKQLKVIPEGPVVDFSEKALDVHVMRGGPVETSRGFVLHSASQQAGSVTTDGECGVRISANIDILHAIAKGVGPDRAAFALGYAGWGAGQLEAEIQNNGWLLCPPSSDILFDEDFETKYERALASIGVDLAMLSGEAGRA
jgi:putative transcriptional regulator